MKAKFTTIFLSIIFLFSCSNDEKSPDCPATACAALQLQINLINEIDNSNYIDSNELQSTDFILSVDDDSSGYTPKVYIFKNDNNESLIAIPFLDTFSILIGNEKTISISATKSDSIDYECCNVGTVENAESTSHKSSYDFELNILTIKL